MLPMALVEFAQIEFTRTGLGPIWKRGRRLVHALGGSLSRAMRLLKSEMQVVFFSKWWIDPQHCWLSSPWPGATVPCCNSPDTSLADSETDMSHRATDRQGHRR